MRSTPVLCPQWCNFNSECRSSSLHKHTALWVLTLLNQEKKGGGKRGQGHDRKVTNTERGGERECCSGWSGPPTEMSKSWFSEHVTVTVFGKKGVCTCNYVKQFKIRSSWITQVGLKSNDKHLYKKETHTHTHRGEDSHRGRHWRDVATSQGMSTATGRWKGQGKTLS